MENRSLTVADLTILDGEEPLIKDLKLAEALGMPSDRLRDIRRLIKKNINEIQLHGTARTKSALFTKGNGAQQEITEYWLTEAQAYVVCRHSNAPNAPAVNKMLIQVFMAWRRGQLVSVPSPRCRQGAPSFYENTTG